MYIDDLVCFLGWGVHLLRPLTEVFLAVPLRIAAVEPFCGMHTY